MGNTFAFWREVLMPWRECSVMEERLRFVARLLDGEGMSDVCRGFGISRKTGYKIFNRYKDEGLEALTDRTRRPVRYANQLPDQIERTIVRLKKDRPHWGARKIRELLIRKLAGDVRIPAKSTVHAVLQQQARFDAFMSEFNDERPHEAIQMKAPAQLYTPSSRAYEGLPEVEYPFHDRDILVTACGRICMHRKKINVSTVLAGPRLGIKEVDDGIWLVSFMHYDLGYIDLEQRTLQTIDNPFGTRLSPMS
jgi:transposase